MCTQMYWRVVHGFNWENANSGVLNIYTAENVQLAEYNAHMECVLSIETPILLCLPKYTWPPPSVFPCCKHSKPVSGKAWESD